MEQRNRGQQRKYEHESVSAVGVRCAKRSKRAAARKSPTMAPAGQMPATPFPRDRQPRQRDIALARLSLEARAGGDPA